jgi:hypothetical protein
METTDIFVIDDQYCCSACPGSHRVTEKPLDGIISIVADKLISALKKEFPHAKFQVVWGYTEVSDVVKKISQKKWCKTSDHVQLLGFPFWCSYCHIQTKNDCGA